MNSRRRISAPKLRRQDCIGLNDYFDRLKPALKLLPQCTATVAYGSKADKPSQAKIHRCPLLSESGQNLRRSAAAGLAHFKAPTRCESSQSLPRRPNQGHIAAAKLFGIKEVPTVRPRISARPTQAGWRLYTLETQFINGWPREFGKLFRLLEDFTSRGRHKWCF
jgi:hypothetical protein